MPINKQNINIQIHMKNIICEFGYIPNNDYICMSYLKLCKAV